MSNLTSYPSRQALDAGALQRGGMNENVLLPVVGLNEAEAFLVVVEFHGAWSQGGYSFRCGRARGIWRTYVVANLPGFFDLSRSETCGPSVTEPSGPGCPANIDESTRNLQADPSDASFDVRGW